MRVGEIKVLSGNANKELARDICAHLNISLCEVTCSRFPDEEIEVQIHENVRGKDVFVIQPTSRPANDHLMELLIMIDAAKRASAARITGVIPFYGYARQDRKERSRVPITAKLIANLLVAAGVDRIVTMDLHAPQIQGFFDVPVDHLYAMNVIYEYLAPTHPRDETVIISPDVGGVKFAAAYADLFACGVGFIAKKRTGHEEVHAIDLVGDVAGRKVLIVDDMTESAGTLREAARIIRDRGAREVRAAVSHGVLTNKGYERLRTGFLDELITTNSTPVKRDDDLGITVLSVAPLLATAISRIHDHESVSDLFNSHNRS